MGQLNNLYVSSSFQGLLKLTDSTQGLTNTLQTIQAGDGSNSPLQMSLSNVNISGSLTVNGQPIEFSNTGSFATTGSNQFNGNQSISGSITTDGNLTFNNNTFISTTNTSGALYLSSLNGGFIGLNTDGGEGDVIVGYNGWNGNLNVRGNTIQTGSIDITGDYFVNGVAFSGGTNGTSGTSGSNGTDGSSGTSGDSLFAQTGSVWNTTNDLGISGSLYVSSSVQKDVIIDGQLWVSSSINTASGTTTQAQINVVGWGPSGGNSRSGSVQITPQKITLSRDTNASGFGTTTIDPFYGITQVTNGIGTGGNYLQGSGSVTNTMGVQDSTFSYYNYQQFQVNSTGSLWSDYDYDVDDYSAWMKMDTNFGNNNPSPQMLRGLKVTGSLTEVGNVYMLSPAFNSGSVKLNITGSDNFVSQSNLIFGSVAGPTNAQNTGSIILSGSNNILLTGVRGNTTTTLGTFGYINGNSNIMNIVPTIATGSLGVTTTGNILYGAVVLDGPVTSSFGSGVVTSIFNGNITTQQNTTTFRHKSGSFNHTGNLTMGAFTSFATSSWFDDSITFVQNTANILQGSGTQVLNVSSSVITNRNIINANSTIINNQFTNPTNYLLNGSGSLSLSNNIFGGTTHTILSSGSNLQNRSITNNIVVGSNHLLNQISSGSFNTIISNTAVLGATLIVSGSNSSTTGGGSTFVGRFNATGSNQETTNETVFVVGTGTAANARRNALRIDSNNNSNFTGSVNISGSLLVNGVSVSSDRNGLITTGSFGGSQSITGSLNMTNGNITVLGAGANLSIQSGSLNLNNDQQSSISNPASGRNVMYVDNLYSNFFFGNVPKGQSGRFSGDTNNFILSPTYSDFQTGSNNLIFAVNNSFFQSGSNNTFIGDGQPFGNNVNDSLYIGMNQGNNQSIITKRGGGSSYPIQLGYPTQVTGSLNVSNGATITGSLIVTDQINNLKIWTGSYNGNSIGIGNNTLNSQTGSSLNNIAIGDGALQTNVTGANVVAIGNNSLGNSVAGFNLAIGASALNANTTGQYNIGIGQSSYQANTIGEKNTAIGWNSGVNNLTGSTNTIIGAQALQQNFNGSGNVAIGYGAGYYSTGSNGFYIGNENYGSLSNEQNKSLMYGEFNSTTANQTLQINAQTTIKNNLVVTGSLLVSGDVMFSSGSNKTMGTVALDGSNPGVATVSNSLVTANSLIFLTKQTNTNSGAGTVSVTSKGTGTFSITSDHNGDTDVVAYQIINPA